ncbi:MAG: rubrerythrin family protein [Nitrospiraceae bacterium]|nr:rubrerythrin family protein [Nitrospiraceae bacterium]
MKSVKGTKTEKNLLTAFAGESQARNRYTYFASQAKKEGYEQISGFFLETADNEREHAKRLFKFLEGGEAEVTAAFPAGTIGDTSANLRAAAAGEAYEYTTMYPQFAAVADEEGFPVIAAVFRAIAAAEKQHEKRYTGLLRNIGEGRVFRREAPKKWKCRNCGYIHEGAETPDKCPACDHAQSYFELLEENW